MEIVKERVSDCAHCEALRQEMGRHRGAVLALLHWLFESAAKAAIVSRWKYKGEPSTLADVAESVRQMKLGRAERQAMQLVLAEGVAAALAAMAERGEVQFLLRDDGAVVYWPLEPA